MSTDTFPISDRHVFERTTPTHSPTVTVHDVGPGAMVDWISSRQAGCLQPTAEWGPFAHGAAAMLLSIYGGDFVPEMNSGDIYLGVVNNREISRPIIELDDFVICSSSENQHCGDSVDDAAEAGSLPDWIRLPNGCTRPAQWENSDDEPEWDPVKYKARLAVEEFYGPQDADPQNS